MSLKNKPLLEFTYSIGEEVWAMEEAILTGEENREKKRVRRNERRGERRGDGSLWSPSVEVETVEARLSPAYGRGESDKWSTTGDTGRRDVKSD